MEAAGVFAVTSSEMVGVSGSSVVTTSVQVFGPAEVGVRPLGQRLADRLPGQVVSVGFAFERGAGRDGPLPAATPESVDGVLAGDGRPLLLLDLRSAPDWFRRRQPLRAQGGTTQVVPAEAFDALVFTQELTPALPNPRAARRFEAMSSR